MSNLNAKFDLITRDPHPNALASLMVVLDVKNPPPVTTPGTPAPGVIAAGHIIMIDSATGKAVLGDKAGHAAATPLMYMVAVDGDMDFDGAFLHRITCLEGGLEMKTEKYAIGGGLLPGQALTVGTGAQAGLLIPLTGAGEPILGWVGSNGVNSDGTLDVIMPQGRSR
jgi:hypothetical protein